MRNKRMRCICEGDTKKECMRLRKEHYLKQRLSILKGQSDIAKQRRQAILAEPQLQLTVEQVCETLLSLFVHGCLDTGEGNTKRSREQ